MTFIANLSLSACLVLYSTCNCFL